MEISVDLKTTLKKLRLSGMLPLLSERASYAEKTKMTALEFLELVLSDERERRMSKSVMKNIEAAHINPNETLERFDFDAKINLDRTIIKDLFSLQFAERFENVIFFGPVGVGKSHLANALGHSLCRIGKTVLMCRAAAMLKELRQSRFDNTYEKEIQKLIRPEVLIVDEFGLTKMTADESHDFYEIVSERYSQGSMIMTSNRSIEEWMDLFHDHMLANSVLDRIAHNAHQVQIDGESYRKTKHNKKDAKEIEKG